MKVALNSHSGVIIGAYRPGEIGLLLPRQPDGSGGKQYFSHSVIITHETLHSAWPPGDFDSLRREHFSAMLDLDVDVVLFGSGSRMRFPDAAILADFYQAGIGFETMDTAAACRTFNILVAEGRPVAAALIIEQPT